MCVALLFVHDDAYLGEVNFDPGHFVRARTNFAVYLHTRGKEDLVRENQPSVTDVPRPRTRKLGTYVTLPLDSTFSCQRRAFIHVNTREACALAPIP